MGRGHRRFIGAQCALAGFLCIAAVLFCISTAHADTPNADDSRLPSAPLHEEVLSMGGDPARPVALQVTLFTPAGPGPFPLAVLNHGANKTSATNRGERYHSTISAYYFLSRGYAVALPMMRGFAGSGGALVRAGCDLAAIAQSNARDMRAVIEALALRPEVDRTRIVVAGQSFGAWNTLGLGASPPAGVRGLVSFNAAIRASNCPAQDSSMAAAAGQLGARTSLPSLWFYGDNDRIMPVATWRAVFGQYSRASGQAELVALGAFGSDSHDMLSFLESLPLWMPKVDAFLARIGMPSTPVYPDYLPRAVPPATRWAELADVAAVPFLSDAGRALYQHFLQAPRLRAVALAPNGSISEASGGYDPLGYALRNCGRSSSQCRLYAVNDDVVWSGPKPASPGADPVRLVARTVRMNVSTPLAAFYGVNPDCSPRGLPQVSVAAAPAHGGAAVAPRDEHPAFPQGSPYAACNVGLVPAMGVTYTPAPGYSGNDALTVEEVNVNGRRQVLRIELTVM